MISESGIFSRDDIQQLSSGDAELLSKLVALMEDSRSGPCLVRATIFKRLLNRSPLRASCSMLRPGLEQSLGAVVEGHLSPPDVGVDRLLLRCEIAWTTDNRTVPGSRRPQAASRPRVDLLWTSLADGTGGV
eukprot:CAMPEP_0117604824 /NCGR_PEP_ID=MMETSP0784-20121206/78882_1 /TAXON_ID=39447 /ORGANISM="" /LENGTH=131 /DNA_ID=CAMNT_0005407859 /DNA_START=220 /DNA_END=612 /DNA_ORIENTATION=+